MKEEFNARQLAALIFTASLAPITRLLPKVPAQTARGAGWISPALAYPALLLFALVLTLFMRRRREGEGLGELVLRLCPKPLAGAYLGIVALFLVLSAGFILKTGAHRLISTIYPTSEPWPFTIAMLALGLLAALGPVKALPRVASIFAPVLLAVTLLALILSAHSVQPRNLLPSGGIGSIFLSSLTVVEIYGGLMFAAAFLEYGCRQTGGRMKSAVKFLALICLLCTTFCLVIIGSYGAALTARFSHPFFSLARDITLLKTIERTEALIAALWVLSDFVIYTFLLCVSSRIIRLLLGYKPEKSEKALSLRGGRVAIIICAGVTAFAALFDGGLTERELLKISQYIIPCISLIILFFLTPLMLLSTKIQEK